MPPIRNQKTQDSLEVTSRGENLLEILPDGIEMTDLLRSVAELSNHQLGKLGTDDNRKCRSGLFGRLKLLRHFSRSERREYFIAGEAERLQQVEAALAKNQVPIEEVRLVGRCHAAPWTSG